MLSSGHCFPSGRFSKVLKVKKKKGKAIPVTGIGSP
jgi:hypothetical protein